MVKALKRGALPPTAKPDMVAAAIEGEIRSGLLGFGDRLDSENQLGKRFAVSRNTIRKGLEELAAKGFITTRMGVGSFVTFRGRAIDDALGWSRALARAGADVETQVLGIERIEDADLASRLGLAETTFIAIDRVRRLKPESRTISLERSRLPVAPGLEDLPERGLKDSSLSGVLRSAGLVPAGGDEWVDLVLVEEADAEIMGCAPGAAFLRTRRLARGADGRPIEHVTSILDPTVFALHLEF